MLALLTFLIGIGLLTAAIYETVCIERLRCKIERQAPEASPHALASPSCHTASKAA